MKKVIVILLFSTCILHGQGIEFKEGTFEEILELAQKENKPIFMDCYTVWCGPCKKMAKEIFTQEKVGAFFNKSFINYKLDMEKGEGVELAQYYTVDSFPTLLFIDKEGNLLNRTRGSIDAKTLIENGEKAMK